MTSTKTRSTSNAMWRCYEDAEVVTRDSVYSVQPPEIAGCFVYLPRQLNGRFRKFRVREDGGRFDNGALVF